ncbi:Protein bem46, partial [Leucoagaricus sp. SymC.cos]
VEVAKPTDHGMPYEDLELITSDGVKLRCYMLRQSKEIASNPNAIEIPADVDSSISEAEFVANRPTVVMFHGNAGNHGHRIPLAKVFFLRMRCNVLMMCYRGYGLSEGIPNEQGSCLQRDAQAALDYLWNDEAYRLSQIILYGQSIGGAVAIDLTSKNPDKVRQGRVANSNSLAYLSVKITALVLENTFTSLPSLIPHTLPLLSPFSFLCHQKWDSISKVPKIPSAMPILMLSGLMDEIVPKEQMQTLYEAFAQCSERTTSGDKTGTELTEFRTFPQGGHNDTCVQDGYWSAVANFVAKLSPNPINY